MAIRPSTILKRQQRRTERARKGGLATKARPRNAPPAGETKELPAETVAYQEPIIPEHGEHD